MSLISSAVVSAFSGRAAVVNPKYPKDPALAEWFGARESAAGVSVTPDSALSLSSVLAGVRVLSETIAALPLFVYERQQPAGKREARELPVFDVLHTTPNPEQTSYEFREFGLWDLLLRGDMFAEKIPDGAGRVRELWPLPARYVEPVRATDGQLWYVVTIPGHEKRRLPRRDVLHVRSFSRDGVTGLGIVDLAREAIGGGLAMQDYAARFFAGDAEARGVLQHPGELSPDARKNMRDSWEKLHKGLENKHRLVLLEEGTTYHKISVDPEEAQFLESRRFSVNEIARFFRVPPHKLGDLERATFSNIEQQNLEFYTESVLPWLVRSEQAYERDLLTREQRRKLDIKHKVEGLLRADSTARAEFYTKMWGMGAYSVNDILELEDRNPIANGDTRWVPLNYVPMQEALEPGSTPAPGGPLPGRAFLPAGTVEERQGWRKERNALKERFEPLFADRAATVVRAEIREVTKQLKRLEGGRALPDFALWLEQYYGFEGEFRTFAQRELHPLYATYVEMVASMAASEVGGDFELVLGLSVFAADLASAFASRHAESSLGQLTAVTGEAAEADADPIVKIETRLEEWNEKRPAKVAKRESVQANRAATKKAWKYQGIRRLRWVASGKTCPFCEQLDGKIVGIDQTFTSAGQVWEAEGREPLTIRRDVGHPPLHGGCDCDLAPA